MHQLRYIIKYNGVDTYVIWIPADSASTEQHLNTSVMLITPHSTVDIGRGVKCLKRNKATARHKHATVWNAINSFHPDAMTSILVSSDELNMFNNHTMLCEWLDQAKQFVYEHDLCGHKCAINSVIIVQLRYAFYMLDCSLKN